MFVSHVKLWTRKLSGWLRDLYVYPYSVWLGTRRRPLHRVSERSPPPSESVHGPPVDCKIVPAHLCILQ